MDGSGTFRGGEAGHWSKIARYDSAINYATLQSVKIPALFVFAQHDVMVPPAENLSYANAIFPNGIPENFSIHTQAGIEHFMHEASSPCDPYPWTKDPVPPYSSDLKQVLNDWLRRLM